MKITFADMDGLVKYVVPVVQPPVKFGQTTNNETFNTLKFGDIKLMGDRGLRTVEWSSFFPVNKKYYNFIESGAELNGQEYVDFLEEHAEEPFRLVITEKYKTIRNMLVTVDTFDYEYNKAGDIEYSLKLEEFPNNANAKSV
jgi:hypothetical protein